MNDRNSSERSLTWFLSGQPPAFSQVDQPAQQVAFGGFTHLRAYVLKERFSQIRIAKDAVKKAVMRGSEAVVDFGECVVVHGYQTFLRSPALIVTEDAAYRSQTALLSVGWSRFSARDFLFLTAPGDSPLS